MSQTPIPVWMKQVVFLRDGAFCLNPACKRLTVRYPDGKVRPDTTTYDHIIPESKGGMTTVENLQILCAVCNRAKGTKVIDFRPTRAPVYLHSVTGPVHRTTEQTPAEKRASDRRRNEYLTEQRAEVEAEIVERSDRQIAKIRGKQQRKADRKARRQAERWLRSQGKADKIPAFREQLRSLAD